jgi:hypothetical protein
MSIDDDSKIEFIDLTTCIGAQNVDNCSDANIELAIAALIKSIEAGDFNALLLQALTGNPLSPSEEDQILAASRKIIKLKHD